MNSILRSLAGGLTLLLLMLSSAWAEETYELDIADQELSSALKQFAEQSGLQVVYFADLANGKQSKGVHGTYSADAALTELLDETNLTYSTVDDRTYALTTRTAAEDEGGDSDSGNGRAVATSKPVMMAQAVSEQSQTSQRTAIDSDKDDHRRPLEEIVVTGTRIKGVKDQFSPVTQVTREEMELAGYNNVSDIFENLPQNFGGGVTIDTSQAAAGDGPGGSGVNLRGLGNQATLVLLNGRRLAGGGHAGQFVDISSIPASAIERVDILTGGASAIYGSDAIAGVVNIILRDDYEGAETRLGVGTITDGGGDSLKAGQTLGWSGDRARAMVTYEYSVTEELDANQKDFAKDRAEPTWLLPHTEKNSVFASTGAQLTDRIKLSADGFFNDRKSKQFTSNKNFGLLLNQSFAEVNVQQYGGAFGLDVDLFDDWDANLSASYSKSDHFNDFSSTVVNEHFSTSTEILSFDGTVGGALFHITDDPVKGVIGGHYRSEKADLMRETSLAGVINDVDKSRSVFAAFGELYAPIISDGNRKPGIESLALSVAARYAEYDDVGSSLDSKVGLAWSPITGLNLRGTYGTSFRAPRLDQLRDNVGLVVLSLFVDPMSPDGEPVVAVSATGERDDLGPERSRTWTAGFDFTPQFLDGLLLRGTYFGTEYSDQVGRATASLDNDFRLVNFMGIPMDISPETARDLCARATRCFNLALFNPSLGDLSFDDVEVLLDQRQQNLSLSKVAGFDFEGSYDLSSTIGDWRFSLGGTLLTTFEQRVALATPIDDLLNTFGNPVDLKLRGGVQLRTRSLTTAIFVNHVGNYLDDEVPTDGVPIDSFTTVDAAIRLDLGELGDSPLTEGTFLSFSAINILNEDPPMIGAAPLRADTFDAANANPAGRKIGILLTKQW